MTPRPGARSLTNQLRWSESDSVRGAWHAEVLAEAADRGGLRSFRRLDVARERGNTNRWPVSDTGRGVMVLSTVERGSLVLGLLLVATTASAEP